MIWQINHVDHAFIAEFLEAGQIDPQVISAHLKDKPLPPNRATVQAGKPRFYYLWREDMRVKVVTVGMPLAEMWDKAVKVTVGSHDILGEFTEQKPYTGRKGLSLRFEAVAWLTGAADQTFPTATEALNNLSLQGLDLDRPARSQDLIKLPDWVKRLK
jgi:hypothetical protein